MRIIFDRLTGLMLLRFFRASSQLLANFVLLGTPAGVKYTRAHPLRAGSYAVLINHASALLEIILRQLSPYGRMTFVALTRTAWEAKIPNPKTLSSVAVLRRDLLHVLDDQPREGAGGRVRSEQNGGHFGDYENFSLFELAEPAEEHLQNQSTLTRD